MVFVEATKCLSTGYVNPNMDWTKKNAAHIINFSLFGCLLNNKFILAKRIICSFCNRNIKISNEIVTFIHCHTAENSLFVRFILDSNNVLSAAYDETLNL